MGGLDLAEILRNMSGIGLSVMVVLLLCSIWSVYVCIERIMFFRKAKQQSLVFAKQVTQYLAQDRVSDAIEASRKYKQSHLAKVITIRFIDCVPH